MAKVRGDGAGMGGRSVGRLRGKVMVPFQFFEGWGWEFVGEEGGDVRRGGRADFWK
jgi:hypothetical protein